MRPRATRFGAARGVGPRRSACCARRHDQGGPSCLCWGAVSSCGARLRREVVCPELTPSGVGTARSVRTRGENDKLGKPDRPGNWANQCVSPARRSEGVRQEVRQEEDSRAVERPCCDRLVAGALSRSAGGPRGSPWSGRDVQSGRRVRSGDRDRLGKLCGRFGRLALNRRRHAGADGDRVPISLVSQRSRLVPPAGCDRQRIAVFSLRVKTPRT